MQTLILAICFSALALPSRGDAQVETVLHNFFHTTGDSPGSGLTIDGAGNLYGTTAFGGSSNVGVVYKLDSENHYTVLYNFTGGSDGYGPFNGVIRDEEGSLYGTTFYGGGSSSGVVFKLDSSGHETVLYTFTGGADGANPDSPLTFDAEGSLYGTTEYGGAAGYGVVYKLDRNGRETVLHSFTSGADGAHPYSGVVLDSGGNLFGTTGYGGYGRKGVVYRISPNGQETILHHFTGGLDGGLVYAGVIRDNQGNLYGATYLGGAFDHGVVFKLNSQGDETVLHSFGEGLDGAGPSFTLTFDSIGNLYGVTALGGASNLGTVFKIDSTTHQEKVVYSFNGPDGGPYIIGPLLINKQNLYGSTNEGGDSNAGVVFRISPVA